jgi:hypothetical protein
MSNNTQGEALAGMLNSFTLEHRVHCFNNTLQLSAKTLLHPFNAGLGKTPDNGDNVDVDDVTGLDLDEDSEDDADDNDNDEEDSLVAPDIKDIDDGINELDALDGDAHEEMLTNTAAVCEMVTKLHRLAFAIV